jgi:modification methylase
VVLDPFFGSGTTGAVAKKLGRNWIGVERDEKYIRVAQERIDAVEPAPPESLISKNPRQQKRIPFGALLEAGLLQPGQTLYFVKDNRPAIVLADGHLQCGRLTGSIHAVAKALVNAPCNGWATWIYETKDGKKVPIDELREFLREKTGRENEG